MRDFCKLPNRSAVLYDPIPTGFSGDRTRTIWPAGHPVVFTVTVNFSTQRMPFMTGHHVSSGAGHAQWDAASQCSLDRKGRQADCVRPAKTGLNRVSLLRLYNAACYAESLKHLHFGEVRSQSDSASSVIWNRFTRPLETRTEYYCWLFASTVVNKYCPYGWSE